MDNKADVKAITARFNAGKSNSTEGMSSAGRPKAALHSTLSSGPPPHPKKPVQENLSGNAVFIPPKPNHLTATKSAPEVRDMAKSKANVFANAKENGNSKPSFAKQQLPFKPTTPHPSTSPDPEVKSPVPKPPPYKPSLSSALLEVKSVPPKPSPAVTSKPSSLSPTPPKVMLQNKPNSSFAKLRLQSEEEEGSQTDSNARTFPPPSGALKPTSNFRAAQSAFNRDKSVEQSEERDRGEVANKKPLSTASATPPVPPISKKPSFIKRPQDPTSRAFGVRGSMNRSDPSAPKRNPLPNILALGNAPSKPNRPPEVNLERCLAGSEANTNEGPGIKKAAVAPPLTSHQRNHASNVASPLTSQSVAPSLPPRPTGAIIQPDPDENYDDIESLVNKPPPLPTTGHPNQMNEGSESDGDMYEFLDDRWEESELKEQEKKKERDDKKRQEVEKKEQKERERKEQKEREKKEQEAMKKFKLSGPPPVIHRAQARVDCKGNKTDLSLKQGDFVDIVRVMDNPGGRWLGRMQDGSYGYVKTDAVEVDFDSLKRHGESLPHTMDHDPDVYDDIDVVTPNDFPSGIRVPGVILPPPPEEAGELYDDLDDPKFNVSSGNKTAKSPPKPRGLNRMLKGFDEWRKSQVTTNEVPPPSQFTANGRTDQTAPAIDEEIYDDVDTLPPPLPLSSPPPQVPKTKPEEIDPKKQKKFEKEEKDFRKKFKFDGEINVLYSVTVVPSLTNKKWSGKDLPIRAGETLDVIAKSTDNKLICRNDEGKFGYVLASHINQEDGDIYDDIGNDVYDND